MSTLNTAYIETGTLRGFYGDDSTQEPVEIDIELTQESLRFQPPGNSASTEWLLRNLEILQKPDAESGLAVADVSIPKGTLLFNDRAAQERVMAARKIAIKSKGAGKKPIAGWRQKMSHWTTSVHLVAAFVLLALWIFKQIR